MKRINIIFFLIFFSIIFAQNEKLVLAINSLRDGFYDFSIKYCDEYLKQPNANVPYAKMIKGLAYYKKQDYNSAISNFKDIVFEYPNFSKIDLVKLYLGISYLEKGEENNGLKYLESLKKIASISCKAYYYEGVYFLQKKMYGKAKDNLSKVVNDYLTCNLWDNANLKLSQLYNSIKRYDLLEDTVLNYVQRNKKGKYVNQLLFLLGMSYYNVDNYDKAIKIFKNLVVVSYKTGDSYYYLADSYYLSNKYQLAVNNYKKAIQFNCELKSNAYENLVLSYINLKKYDLAIKTLKEIIQQKINIPKNRIEYYYLKIYYDKKEYENALVHANYLLKNEKDKDTLIEIIILKGNILFKMKKKNEAIAFLENELKIIKAPLIYELLGDIYSSLSQFKKAENNYQLAINTQSNVEAKNLLYKKLLNVYYNLNEYDKAIETGKNITISAQDDKYFLNMGKNYYALKEYDKAKGYFEKIKKSSPLYFKAQHYLGWVLIEEGKTTDAIEFFGKLLDEIPQNNIEYQLVKFDLGKLFYHIKNYSKALPIFIDIYNNKNFDFRDELLYYLSKSYYKIESFDEAKKYFKQLFSSKKYGNEAKLYYAWCFLNENQYDKAINAFMDVYNDKNNPYRFDAILKVGDIYFNEKKYEEAIKVFEEIINTPNIPEKYKGLAAYNREWAYFKLGKYKNSLEVSQNFLNKFPNSPIAPQIQLNMGKFYFSKEDYKNALDKFQELLVKYPDSDEVYESKYYIGLCFMRLQNLDKAFLYFNDLQGNNVPNKWKNKAQFKLASILFFEKKYNKALLNYKELLKKDISQELYENILYNMAIIYKQLREYEKARESMEKLVSISNDSKLKNDGRIFLGELYELMGEKDKAIEMYSQVIIEGNTDQQVEAEFWLGKLYENNENYDKAIEEFMKIVYLYKEYTMWVGSARFEIVNCYLKKGDKENAKKMLKLIINNTQNKDEKFKAFKMLKNLK